MGKAHFSSSDAGTVCAKGMSGSGDQIMPEAAAPAHLLFLAAAYDLSCL